MPFKSYKSSFCQTNYLLTNYDKLFSIRDKLINHVTHFYLSYWMMFMILIHIKCLTYIIMYQLKLRNYIYCKQLLSKCAMKILHIRRLYQVALSGGFIRRLYQAALSGSFIRRLYQAALSGGFIRWYYQVVLSDRMRLHQAALSSGFVWWH